MDDSKTVELLMKINANVSALNEKFSSLENTVKENNKRHDAEIVNVKDEIERLKKEVADLKNKDIKEEATILRKAKSYIFTILGTTIVTFLLAHLDDLIRSFGGH